MWLAQNGFANQIGKTGGPDWPIGQRFPISGVTDFSATCYLASNANVLPVGLESSGGSFAHASQV